MTTGPIHPEPEAEAENSHEHTDIPPNAESMTPERRAWMRAILTREEANNPGVAWAEWLGSALLALDAAEADLQNCLRARSLDAIILNAAAQIMGVQAIDPQNEEEAIAFAQKLHARARGAIGGEIVQEYTDTNFIADLRLIRDAQDRTKRWLWDQLIAAGLDRTIEPCQVVPDYKADGAAWKLVGARCWCGNARLSGSRSLSVVWSKAEAAVFCESYGGHKTYGVGNGATVVEAIKDLLSKPRRGGVPQVFLASTNDGK